MDKPSKPSSSSAAAVAAASPPEASTTPKIPKPASATPKPTATTPKIAATTPTSAATTKPTAPTSTAAAASPTISSKTPKGSALKTTTAARTPKPTTSASSNAVDLVNHALQTRAALTQIYGNFEEFQKLHADKQRDAIPFLSLEKYDDPQSALQTFSNMLAKNYERQKDELERIYREKDEKQEFEAQKEKYDAWNERRKKHQETSASPFMEPPPNVSQKVLDFFAAKDVGDIV